MGTHEEPGLRWTSKARCDIHVYQEGTSVIAVRLPPQVEKRLARLARRTGRSKTYYVREAILQHLDDLEEYYLAVRRLEENLPGIPLEEVERRLGLAD